MQDEQELIKSCKDGDMLSFELLVSQYEKTVYSIAFRMIHSEQDALDLTQEVFIKVYRSIARFDEKSKFSTWIYRITTNACLDFLRKNKKHAGIVSFDAKVSPDDKDDLYMQLEDPSADTHAIVERKLENERLIRALDRLSPEHKAAIVLKDIQGLSHDEIAKVLRLNVGTVKSRISRARESLKKILTETERI